MVFIWDCYRTTVSRYRHHWDVHNVNNHNFFPSLKNNLFQKHTEESLHVTNVRILRMMTDKSRNLVLLGQDFVVMC